MKTAAERRAGYPRDLNTLVNQRFFRCLGCDDLFHASQSGAHHARHCAECGKEWRARQIAAMKEVRRAVMDGRLPPVKTLRCVDCDYPATDYEHRTYDRPLDVVATCRSCNQKRGHAGAKFEGK